MAESSATALVMCLTVEEKSTSAFHIKAAEHQKLRGLHAVYTAAMVSYTVLYELIMSTLFSDRLLIGHDFD